MPLPTLSAERKIKYENTTMYKNNSGLIAKMKVSKYKKGLCLTEKLVSEIRYYSYTRPLPLITPKNGKPSFCGIK